MTDFTVERARDLVLMLAEKCLNWLISETLLLILDSNHYQKSNEDDFYVEVKGN